MDISDIKKALAKLEEIKELLERTIKEAPPRELNTNPGMLHGIELNDQELKSLVSVWEKNKNKIETIKALRYMREPAPSLRDAKDYVEEVFTF